MRRYADLALRVAALTGVAVSGLMAVDYALPVASGVCGASGGCMLVRLCRAAQVLGIGWPEIGLVAFTALLVMSLMSSPRVRSVLPYAGLLAGITGFALIVVQRTVCHAYCPYCLVADGAGILAAVAAWMGRPVAQPLASGAGPYRAADAPARFVPEVSTVQRWAFGALAVVSVLGAFVWGMTRTGHEPAPVRAPLPEVVAREQRPGFATIVEFADFECPFCREQHRVFTETLTVYSPRVRFIRKHLPLPSHVHAEDAARAACCAEEQGKGEPMADLLFQSDDLSRENCETLASRINLDMAVYRECVGASRTTERLHRDRDMAGQAGVRALPTTFIGNERFEGVVSKSALQDSVNRALGIATLARPSVRPST